MKIEVDFPTTGLPEGVELTGLEMRMPKEREYYFSGNVFVEANFDFQVSSHFVAITKPKEVWLPCTPEDAFAKMLHPDSRVIRTKLLHTPVVRVGSVTCDSRMTFLLENRTFMSETSCPMESFEVLKTKEMDK